VSQFMSAPSAFTNNTPSGFDSTRQPQWGTCP